MSSAILDLNADEKVPDTSRWNRCPRPQVLQVLLEGEVPVARRQIRCGNPSSLRRLESIPPPKGWLGYVATADGATGGEAGLHTPTQGQIPSDVRLYSYV